jgi:hypothetical protein
MVDKRDLSRGDMRNVLYELQTEEFIQSFAAARTVY